MNSLFPNLDAVNDSLEITYDGPSFNGVMEINLLGKEIAGLAYCLKHILKKLKDGKRIQISENEIEIFVEAFERGSFKQLIKWLEKHPSTSNALIGLGLVFVGVVQVVVSHEPTDIKRMSPELMAEVGDSVKVQLLSDQKFLDSLAATVSPLRCEEDKIVFKHAPDAEVVVSYDKRACFMELSSVNDTDLPVVKVEEELKGRIVMIDIDATKNQVGFKVEGKGNEIRCSIADGLTIDEFKPHLGDWVKIDSISEKQGDSYIFILIRNFEQIEAPKQPTQEKIDF